MKPRLEPERDTAEDADIWLRALKRAIRGGPGAMLPFSMWALYRDADRRDATIMYTIAIAYADTCRTVGRHPRGYLGAHALVRAAITAGDSNLAFQPARFTYPTSHKRQ